MTSHTLQCILYRTVVLSATLLLSTPTVLFANLYTLSALQLLHQSAAAWVDAVPPPWWLPSRGRNKTLPPCRASPSTPSWSPGSLSSRVCLPNLLCWLRRRLRWWWPSRWWVYQEWKLVSRNTGYEIRYTPCDVAHTAVMLRHCQLPCL